MDLIERLFGLFPDNGNGTVELLISVGIALVGLYAIWRKSGAHLTVRFIARVHRAATSDA